jgi:hypothetical protein
LFVQIPRAFCVSVCLSVSLSSRKKKKMPPPEEIVIGFAGRVLQDRYSLAEYNIQVRDFFSFSLFSFAQILNWTKKRLTSVLLSLYKHTHTHTHTIHNTHTHTHTHTPEAKRDTAPSPPPPPNPGALHPIFVSCTRYMMQGLVQGEVQGVVQGLVQGLV